MQKKRIAYIDFMKGLCIMLIVIGHTGGNVFDDLLPHLNIALKSFRIPLYFFLSGLFFKSYDGFSDFLRKKTNNLIVTLLFFHFLCFILKYPFVEFIQSIRPDINLNFNFHDIIPPFLGRHWKTAGALWFLEALFLVNLIFYLFQKYLSKRLIIIAVFISSIIGYVLMKRHIILPFEGDIALVGLPYFLLGFFIKERGLQNPTKYDKWGYATFIPCSIFVYYFSEDINFLYQGVPNYLLLYLVPFVAILSLFWLCKNLKYVPLICYYGRYSIIILGTHQLHILYTYFIIRSIYPIEGNFMSLSIFVVVMALEVFVIMFMKKYFPKFTAQEELFKHGWKLSKPQDSSK